MWKSIPSLAISVAVGLVIAGGALTMVGSIAGARPINTPDSGSQLAASNSLTRFLDEISVPKQVNNDGVRKAIGYVQSQLSKTNIRTSKDFLVAAQIAAKGTTPEDALLAHDLACCALAMGEQESRSIVAQALDQYLSRTGREQRYGTQPGEPADGTVTQGMRFIMGVDSSDAPNRHSEPRAPKHDLTKSIVDG